MISTELTGHVVIIGADNTTVRLVEELERAGEQLVVIGYGTVDSEVLAELSGAAAELIMAGPTVHETDLVRAGIAAAKAAVIIGENDVLAVRLALAVDELNPKARLVLEMADPRFGEKLAPLLGECQVLSAAELAAPAFVAAALAATDTQTFEIGGRLVVAGPRERVGGEILAVIGDTQRSGIDAVLPGKAGDVLLGTKLIGTERTKVPIAGLLGALTHVFDRRIRFVLLGLAVLIFLSTGYFHFVGLPWLTSIYLALTASTDTGMGDVGELPLGFRFGAVAIQLFGLVLSSGITAVIVDALLSSRLAALTGSVRGRPRHHIVVCGLGRIGISVASRLHRRGIPVVAIEWREEADGVLEARRLKIPVLIADASDAAAQATAGVGRADAVLALTDDEAVNLEIGLVARTGNPGVRVVTRLFDHDLAGRVERRLKLGATRSVSMLAAPAFAAAALGRRSEVIFPIGRRVVLFTEVQVHAESAAPGQRVAELEASGACKILAIAGGADGVWDWQPAAATVAAADRLAVVATRAGLARLLLVTKKR